MPLDESCGVYNSGHSAHCFVNCMKKPLARVLAIEDHHEIGDLLRSMLARAMIDATVFRNGEEALRHLATHTYDLILIDITLPAMNGFDVCSVLKADERLKHIPVIFVSGQTGQAYKDQAEQLGAVAYLEKPIDMLPFLSLVVGHLQLKLTAGITVQKLLHTRVKNHRDAVYFPHGQVFHFRPFPKPPKE